MNHYEVEQSNPRISERLANRKIEIAGISVKCISSNVRRPDISWSNLQLVNGRGNESNLVLVQSLSDLGSTVHVEDQQGRDERIYQDDKFIGVLANRHSGTSESGEIPAEGLDINEDIELHLLSTGGVIGVNTGIPARMYQKPLCLKPLGLVANDHGKPLDLIDLCGPHHEILNPSAPIIMVCGTSAEVGKTTTSASLIKAFNKEGLQTGGTKFSGTGRMRDILSLRDAGAIPWLDFPDVGLATTYTSPERFTRGIYTLFNYINLGNPDIIVAEAGGDPIEANVPTFLRDQSIMRNVRAFIVVAGDVMGMMGTINYLKQFAPSTPIFLTDPKDRNFMATRDRVRHELPGIPMFNSLNSSEVQDVAKQILNLKA